MNYIEPFCNSAAVLLARPTPGRIETVNDLNCYVANFWRATRADPEAVAGHADWPVNESDLHARHRWLVLSRESAEFRERMRVDPEYHDARIAGWWAWGACCWIGSGWCDDAPALAVKLPDISGHAGGSGRGLHQSSGPSRKRPILAGAANESGERNHFGLGVHSTGPGGHRPQLADARARGRGVHGNDSAERCEARRDWLVEWFGRLSDRLRTVRVCCGHWLRVCDSFSVTTRLGMTGVFFDAPYKTHLQGGAESRSPDLYANDRTQDVNALVDEVIRYCVERGNDPLMRIAACCYEGEGYEVLESLGWDCLAWKSGGGYANRGKAKGRPENAARERIWFSPGCSRAERDRMPLFAREGP